MSALPTTPAAQRGTTTVADAVVLKVAAAAVRGVPGVHPRRGGATQGVSVSMEEESAAVAVELVGEHGASLPAVAEAVRRAVTEAVRSLTGLRVRAVDVLVTDVHVPAADAAAGPAAQPAGPAAASVGGGVRLPRTRTTAR